MVSTQVQRPFALFSDGDLIAFYQMEPSDASESELTGARHRSWN